MERVQLASPINVRNTLGSAIIMRIVQVSQNVTKFDGVSSMQILLNLSSPLMVEEA